MASYIRLIQQDVVYHEGASSWPLFISQLARSLLNDLKLPRSLDSDPVPYTNKYTLELLHQLRVSDDATRNDLWDDTDRIIPDDVQQCLHAAFNTTLTDCARIQSVLRTEQATGTPFPKESFLAVLVRNAMLNADPELRMLDDVPVILPRHFSGETIPILKYMTKSFLAPLVISIGEQIPILQDDSDPDLSQDLSDDEEDGSEPFNYRPVTVSEFLCGRDGTVIHEEEEEEEETFPSQFEAYFLACHSPAAPPSVCHIPILCMGDEDQLPVMMSSFLYQRRVWRINDPLVGLESSKYDTVIKLYLGWLEDDASSDRVLPRVHLAEIATPVMLDLASPSVALAMSRLLCGLESHISGVRGIIRDSVGAVVSGTRSHSPLSWRIDTEVPQQILNPSPSRDILQWAERQRHSELRDEPLSACVSRIVEDTFEAEDDLVTYLREGKRGWIIEQRVSGFTMEDMDTADNWQNWLVSL